MTDKNQEKLLLKIVDRLDSISSSMVDLNNRMDRLEGKTDDIHKYVPFVGWLEGVGQTMSKKWIWLKSVPDVPRLRSDSSQGDNLQEVLTDFSEDTDSSGI